MPELPTFTGARGVYRPLRKDDAEALFVAHADPAVHYYWASPAHASLQESRAYTARTLEMTPYNWALTQDGGEALGRISMFVQRQGVAEVGLILRAAAQGQGLAGEALRFVADYAFGELKVHRLWADVDPDNAASLALFERNGFVREGLLRHNWRTHLGLRDSVVLARIGNMPGCEPFLIWNERRFAMAAEQPAAPPEKLTEERVRAGHTGDGVRYVLIISLALVVVAFVLVLGGFIG
jgi:[ribosomal protein S5]-alanine N-acetyltransferase